jgi:external thioesterase TEII
MTQLKNAEKDPEMMYTYETSYKTRKASTNTNRPQLFLLHFAGGSRFSYDFLKDFLTSEVEFIPLELPGRGKRMHEELLKNKDLAIKDYVNQIKRLRNDQPFLLYGHSMGATLSLNITKELELIGNPPSHLIVSGNPGPGVSDPDDVRNKKRYLMNDQDFKNELRQLGGVPEEVLIDDELYYFFSSILRADFEILEKAIGEKDIQLETPIYAMMGSEEKSCDKIRNWKRFTSKAFESRLLPGGHFFIHVHPDAIAKIIIGCCEKLIPIR